MDALEWARDRIVAGVLRDSETLALMWLRVFGWNYKDDADYSTGMSLFGEGPHHPSQTTNQITLSPPIVSSKSLPPLSPNPITLFLLSQVSLPQIPPLPQNTRNKNGVPTTHQQALPSQPAA